MPMREAGGGVCSKTIIKTRVDRLMMGEMYREYHLEIAV
jgi:hypothetical protein